MQNLNAVIGEYTKCLGRHKRLYTIFSVLVFLFSIGLSVAGIVFYTYTYSTLNSLANRVFELASRANLSQLKQPLMTGEQISGIATNNHLWLPVIGGFVIGLLCAIYMMRMHLMRSLELEKRNINFNKI